MLQICSKTALKSWKKKFKDPLFWPRELLYNLPQKSLCSWQAQACTADDFCHENNMKQKKK